MRDVVLDRLALDAVCSDVITRGGCFWFIANGKSMWPTLRPEDVIWVGPPSELSRGSIVLARLASGQLVVHRITGRFCRQGGYVLSLKGDSCIKPDGLVRREDVIGKVVARSRQGKVVKLDTWPLRWVGLTASWAIPLWLRVLRWSAHILS